MIYSFRTCRNATLSLLSALLSALTFSAGLQADEVVMAYPQNESVGLAMGWDMEKNTSVPNICIKNYKAYSTSKNDLTQGFKQGNNSFSLQESLNVSYKERVKASETAGVIAREKTSGSLSASVALASNFDMAKDSRYIVASQNYVTRWESLQSDGGVIELTDQAKAFSPDEFAKNCGSAYVARIEYGGVFHALFNMQSAGYTTTSAFKASLQQRSGAKISALGQKASGSESNSAKTSASSNIQNVQSQISIHVHESGAKPTAAGTDVDSVLDQYASYATRVTDDSASEFLLAVVPYPQSTAPLANLEVPYVVLGREFSKWSYLDSLLNKILSASTTGASNNYTAIKGVTLSVSDLQYMQDMAAAKVTAIQGVIESCLQYVDGPAAVDTAGLSKNCSLDGLQVDFTTTKNGRAKTSKVDVMESDVYYLVRLPFSKHVYDGQIATGSATASVLSYQDIITNQVNGIYSERCGGSVINIANYCETAANVARAVNDYVGDDKGQMYYRYRAFAGDQADLCMSFENNSAATNMTIEDCSTAALFGFDESTRQVKVRLYDPNDTHEADIKCLTRTQVSHYGSSTDYGHHLSLSSCQDSVPKSQNAAMVYWEPSSVATASGGSNEVKVVMLRDTNYDEFSESDKHTNCATANSQDSVGREVLDQLCDTGSKPSKKQQWQQLLGQFYLEAKD